MTQILSETKTSLRFSAPEIDSGLCESSNTPNDEAKHYDQLINELNNAVQPPQKLSASDVVIRTMYLVSDQVNQYSGKFDLSELEKIARLCVDAPVMIGHRKDKLPVGRVFKAELVKRDRENWVKVYFYWLRDVTGSETMAGNIDGGIYKECSLGFVYTKAECVRCGNDIRECGHHAVNQIGARPNTKNTEPLFSYKGTQRILEISLVYRGATNNTKISNDLGMKDAEGVSGDSRIELESIETPEKNENWLAELSIRRERVIHSSQKYSDTKETARIHDANKTRAMPLYDGLPLALARRNGQLSVMRDDLSEAPELICEYVRKHIGLPACDFAVYGRLIGMRGKERRSLSDLIRFLRDEGGPVRHAKFYALATLSNQGSAVSSLKEMDTTRIFNVGESKSRCLSFPKPIDLSKSAAMESYEAISFEGDNKFIITRVIRTIELTHKLSESEVARGTVRVKSTQRNEAPDLLIHLKKGEALHKLSNRNVIIRGAGIEAHDGNIYLVNPRIVANLYDYATPEDTLIYDCLVGNNRLANEPGPLAAPNNAIYARLVQPGILVRASALDIAIISGNKKREMTLGAGVPGAKPLRVRIIRLINSKNNELALLRVNDNTDNKFAVAA